MDQVSPREETGLADERHDQLRRLCRRSNLRSALTLGCDWGLVVVAAGVSIQFPSIWVYLLSVLVISRQMNAISELHHHAMHGNLFPSRRLNYALEFLYSLPLFTRVEADRADHLEHHRTYSVANNDHLDWGRGYGLNLARRGERWYMLWFLLVRPFCGLLQFDALKSLVVNPHWRDKSFRRAMLIFWGVVLAAFGAAGRLDLLFWYWLVPYFSFFQVFFFWDDMLGHYNCPQTGTREMRGLTFLLFTAHGTTHHNIHHLYPTIPWFQMPRATRIFVDQKEVDVAYGFWDGIKQMVEPQQ